MFTTGSRITDIVGLYRCRGQYPAAVRTVRDRVPEKRRWRQAVAGISESAGALVGTLRFRIVEPVREMVLDLPDKALRNHVILDAWQHGIDFDRGEVLAPCTTWDLRRTAYFSGVELERLSPWLRLPMDSHTEMSRPPVVLAARDRARFCRSHAALRSQAFGPLGEDSVDVRRSVIEYLEEARRWDEFAVSLCN